MPAAAPQPFTPCKRGPTNLPPSALPPPRGARRGRAAAVGHTSCAGGKCPHSPALLPGGVRWEWDGWLPCSLHACCSLVLRRFAGRTAHGLPTCPLFCPPFLNPGAPGHGSGRPRRRRLPAGEARLAWGGAAALPAPAVYTTALAGACPAARALPQPSNCFSGPSLTPPCPAPRQVVEVEAETMPLGPGNPHGVGFDITQRVLGRESEAQRMCAPERSRVWKVRAVGGRVAREAWHLACVHPCGTTSGKRRVGMHARCLKRQQTQRHCCSAASQRATHCMPNRSVLPPTLPPPGPKPKRAQPRDRQACGVEAHARHALPAHAGAREARPLCKELAGRGKSGGCMRLPCMLELAPNPYPLRASTAPPRNRPVYSPTCLCSPRPRTPRAAHLPPSICTSRSTTPRR